MMSLYQQVAEIHNSEALRVEHSMRFAEFSAFHNCSLQKIKEFLDEEKESYNLSNSELLAIILKKV